MYTSHFLQHSSRNSNQSKGEKGKKGKKEERTSEQLNWKEIKLSVCRNMTCIIFYVQNPEEFTQKNPLLELIKKLNKVAGYKTKTQKSVVFLYGSNE